MKNNLTNQLKNYTVLYVENEDLIRNSIANTLKYYFKEVYEAINGEDAYDLYLEYKPDLIISDIQMPKKNGIKMVEEIRVLDKDTLILITTAYSSEEYLLQLINLHINHYIIKPVNSNNLLEGIIKAFGDKLDKKLYFTPSLYFDMKIYKLFYKGIEVLLRKRDIDFLLLLHKNKNQILTYALIEENLWKDTSMSASALKTFIKEFRKRIPIDIISNIYQIGYKCKNL